MNDTEFDRLNAEFWKNSALIDAEIKKMDEVNANIFTAFVSLFTGKFKKALKKSAVLMIKNQEITDKMETLLREEI